MTRLYTIGQIARELDVPVWTAMYLVESRKIEPVDRVGRVRVWSDEQVSRMKAERARMTRDGAFQLRK